MAASMKIFIVVFLLCYKFSLITASEGDRLYTYKNCLKSCLSRNCAQNGVHFSQETTFQQDWWCKLFGWRCRDECKYHCMWSSVEKLQDGGREVRVKFHGKWPFRRIMGMQEPASVFASLLNFITNAYMYSKLRVEFSVRSRPAVLLWHFFAIVCMNAWFWSMVFHTRDTPFTEFMDYTCALSMVMGMYLAAMLSFREKAQTDGHDETTRVPCLDWNPKNDSKNYTLPDKKLN